MLAHRLRQLRLSKGLTQEELAEVLHISKETISRYESGLREPSISTLAAIVDFYDVDFNYILGVFDRQHFPADDDILMMHKFHSLDDRGKAAVLNTLEHEFKIAVK